MVNVVRLTSQITFYTLYYDLKFNIEIQTFYPFLRRELGEIVVDVVKLTSQIFCIRCHLSNLSKDEKCACSRKFNVCWLSKYP